MSWPPAGACSRASVAEPLPVAVVLEARRRERQRLSSVLHDEVAGGLTAAGLALDLLKFDLPTELQPRVAEIQRTIEESFDAVRSLSRAFHPDPAVRFRLVPALEALGRQFSNNFHGRFELIIDDSPDAEDPPHNEARAYYAVAEAALDNVLRHSSANEAGLTWTNRLGVPNRLVVHDNGRGFHPPSTPTGSGTRIMEYYVEMVGLELEIQSALGIGTRIEMARRSPSREPSGSAAP